MTQWSLGPEKPCQGVPKSPGGASECPGQPWCVTAVSWGGWKTLGLGTGFCESPASFLVGIKAGCWPGNLRVVSNAGLASPRHGIL